MIVSSQELAFVWYMVLVIIIGQNGQKMFPLAYLRWEKLPRTGILNKP